MTQVFTWVPLIGPQGDTTNAVLSAKFGDGYDQTAGDGINNESDSWPLNFLGDEEKIGPIVQFLKWHGGYKSFWWTPPLRDPGLFRCASRSLVPIGAGLFTLAVKFEETFAP
jgi:phage-related protein